MNTTAIDIYKKLDVETQHAAAKKKQNTMLWLMFCSVGLLAMFAILDYVLILDSQIRWSMFLLLLGGTIWRCRALYHAYKEQVSILEVAKDVQQKAQNEQLVVQTAAETFGKPASTSEVAVLLEQNLHNKAQKLVAETPLHSKRSIVAYSLLTLCAVFFAMMVWYSIGGFSFKRVLTPWTADSYTKVKLETHDRETIAEEGSVQPIVVHGKILGRHVSKATASFSGMEKEIAVSVSQDGTFDVPVPAEVASSTTLTVTAGDGSESIRIVAAVEEKEPELEEEGLLADFEIEVIPPPYAQRLSRVESSPSFSVLRKSSLRFQLNFSSPMTKVELVLVDQDGLVSSAGSHATQLSPVNADATVFECGPVSLERSDLIYRVRAETADGRVLENDEPYRISVRDDAPPKVRIGKNNAQKIADVNSLFKFTVHTSDDVAVENIGYTVRKLGKPEEAYQLKIDTETPWKFSTEAVLDLAKLGLAPLDVIVVTAVAVDGNNIDGPGIGRSEPFLLEIPEPPVESPPSEGKGGGTPPEVVNPYEVQLDIFKSTAKLFGTSEEEFSILAEDQRTNIENTEKLIWGIKLPPAHELFEKLRLAQEAMRKSTQSLEANEKRDAMEHQEQAISYFVEARKLMELAPPGST